MIFNELAKNLFVYQKGQQLITQISFKNPGNRNLQSYKALRRFPVTAYLKSIVKFCSSLSPHVARIILLAVTNSNSLIPVAIFFSTLFYIL